MSLLEAMALDQDLDQLVSLFRLLSDKTRLNVLFSLARGERNVTSLCEELGLPQPTVSHHLGLLRGNNVITNRRNGKQIFYSLHAGVTLVDENTMEIAAANIVVKISHHAKTAHLTGNHPENTGPSRE
ncbi:MAG: metalloregulator ArsR/SmtB family transcription factor [Tepidisphaeraceae bacterium]|jgi:DNA-binding transcriptional ArsR family regulator